MHVPFTNIDGAWILQNNYKAFCVGNNFIFRNSDIKLKRQITAEDIILAQAPYYYMKYIS